MSSSFETPRLELASYLDATGHRYDARLDESSGKARVLFVFHDTVPADTLAYNDGAQVVARDYFAALNRARSVVFWLTRDRR